MKPGSEAQFLTKSISQFIYSYAPNHLTESEHTLKSYISTLSKYLTFLGFSCKIEVTNSCNQK